MTAAKTPAGVAPARTTLGRMRPRRNPWRHPWFLEGFTWLYLIWSLMPVALAVLFSFNNGRSQSGTIMLAMSFVIAIIGFLGYRFLTRSERGSRLEALTTIAGSEG